MRPPTLLARLQLAVRLRHLSSLASAGAMSNAIIARTPTTIYYKSLLCISAFGYANYVEWHAGREDDDAQASLTPSSSSSSSSSSSKTTTTASSAMMMMMPLLPRDRYDPDAIADHWGRRPVSVVRRLASIALELGPVATRYLVEYHALPRLMTTMTTTIGGLGRDRGDGDAAADDGEGASGDDDDGDDAEGRIRRSSRSSRSRSSRRREEEMEIELSTRLRSSLATLGPTFVKAGQQLSIRPDLVSPIVLRELQRLCDAVPPFDDGVAMRVLAEELTSSSSSSSSLRRMSNGGDDDEDAIRTSKKIVEKEDVDAAILRVFEEMPILVASASLGQVYKATLRSNDGGDNDASTGCGATTTGLTSSTSASSAWGREVAIKIQRPDILETVSLDLYLLVSYGKMMDKLCSLMTEQIPYHEMFLNGFANGAYMEMNYVHEAENQIYFRNELHSRFHGNNNGNCSSNNNNSSNGGGDGHSSSMKVGANEKYNMNIGGMLSLLRGRLIRAGKRKKGKVVERVIVPEVYERYTTERILVTEWIDGTPLARAPPEQIRALIPVGVELLLVQLLDIGRFHADPHPGNLYVTTSRVDGVTPTLCLLDFGLIAHVSESDRSNMTRAIVNLLQGDYDALISRDAKDLGFLPRDMDVTELKPVLEKILKHGLLDSGSNLHNRKRNLMAISNELNEVFFRYPFSVPPFFALVTRGLGLLEGIALTGDPSFDIFQASYPYAKRRAIETFSVSKLWKDFT